jgi:spore coat polysaccharide biosynthesis protein SpsF (cytidylyltransferase family)
MRTVAVIQARMGSTRLPGKVLAEIAGQPLVEWTLRSVAAIPGLDAIVVATTTDSADDGLAGFVRGLGFPVHRGPVTDVLTRVWDAIAPFDPDLVLRQTGDNPFPDPGIAARQRDRLVEADADYVGIAGWPLGIAAEVCRVEALEAAVHEATDPAEREHVMPFIYQRPERFRIASLARQAAGPAGGERWRYTVDTEADLAVARSLAGRIGHGPPVALDELEAVLVREPALAAVNVGVEQRSWQVVEQAAARGRQKEPD